MRVRRIAAEQAHSVPTQSYYAPSIFAPEVVRTSPIEIDDNPPDDGGGHTPPGSTAQNGFREVLWYRCNFCGEILRETHLEGHTCEEQP